MKGPKKQGNKREQDAALVIVIVAVIAAALLSAASADVEAIPQPAAEYYGTVTLHGESAEAGTNVSAFDQAGVKCGTYVAKSAGLFGLLSCNGDDTGTPSDEGAAAGEQVIFRTNGTLAYVIEGNSSWNSGNFSQVSVLGLRNDSPFLYGCRNSTIAEDGNGTNISVDMWSCAYDRNDNASSLNFSVTAQSNSSLISCLVSSNRYFTCNNPVQDGNGVSHAKVNAVDTALLQWSINLTVNVTPVNDSPAFLHNFTAQNTSDGSQFLYDINCSDPDGDAVYYYDNTTLFDIESTTGLINFTPLQSHVGAHSIMITCNDETLSATANFTLTVNDVNNPPALDLIGDLQARTGFLFTKKITASDPDNNTLTFSDNVTLFDINSATGVINFTPSDAQIGNYSVNISVSDGSLSDYEVVNFSVRQGAFCGDGVCSGAESCSSCQTDCGQCQSGAGGEVSGEGQAQGGAGAEAGAAALKRGAVASAVLARCVEKWKCMEWQECVGNDQMRLCRDISNCRSSTNKPTERRVCEVVKQAPIPSCSDRVKNQNEEGVDCGGVCMPCTKKVFATLPLLKIGQVIGKLSKQLPLIMILAAMLISLATMASDHAYLSRTRRLPLKVYREKMRRYKLVRKLMYRTLINTLLIIFIVSAYYYWFSNCADCLKRQVWMLAAAVIAAPFAVAAVLNKLEFREYKMAVSERRLKNTHEQQIRQLLKLETKLALEAEQELARLIRTFDAKNPENSFAPLLGEIKELAAMHSKQLACAPVSDEAVGILESAAADKELVKAAKAGFEPKQLLIDVKALLKALKANEENVEAEKNFVEGMEDVASNKILIETVAANEQLSRAYNSLVDVYSELIERHRKDEQALKEERKAEERLLEGLAKIFEDKEQAEKNSGDKEWVRVYNLLIDLSNHFRKKHETSQ